VAEGSDGVKWIEGEDGKGTLQVVGTVRGGCLSADRLVHIPGVGDLQIESVCQVTIIANGRFSLHLHLR
jgi:pre-rRNA-processing protein TSR1